MLALIPCDHASSAAPGEQLRFAIQELGLNQRAAASLLGVTRQNLNNLIRGRQKVSKKLALKLDTLTNKPAGHWLSVWCRPKPLETEKIRLVSPHEHLRLEMERLGLDQEEMSEALGVSRQSINCIVRGKQAISRTMSQKLGFLMELPSDYWLRNEYVEGIAPRIGAI